MRKLESLPIRAGLVHTPAAHLRFGIVRASEWNVMRLNPIRPLRPRDLTRRQIPWTVLWAWLTHGLTETAELTINIIVVSNLPNRSVVRLLVLPLVVVLAPVVLFPVLPLLGPSIEVMPSRCAWKLFLATILLLSSIGSKQNRPRRLMKHLGLLVSMLGVRRFPPRAVCSGVIPSIGLGVLRTFLIAVCLPKNNKWLWPVGPAKVSASRTPYLAA